MPDVAKWDPWRADLAWNFDLPVRSLVLAHAALRVPGIQAGGTLYAGCHGVSWRGAKSRFMVTSYAIQNYRQGKTGPDARLRFLTAKRRRP